jgi:hypothetical protein
MLPDPNDEILEIKRRLSAEFGHDIHRIAAETRRRQNLSGRKILSLPPRRFPAEVPTNISRIRFSGEGGEDTGAGE